MGNELQVQPGQRTELTPAEVKHQVNLIQEVMRDVMQDGEHYGAIPGCGTKKVLLKGGAEKLLLTFRLHALVDHEQVSDMAGGHREYRLTVGLHNNAGTCLGQGVGSCSTMESKYRFREAGRKCPQCGKEAIIKGKADFGGGWLCFAKKGGCGAKWQDGAQEIESQATGRIENDNPADQWNTCYKMAHKRALVSACLVTLAASDIFTQDLDEDIPVATAAQQPTTKPATQPEQSQPAPAKPASQPQDGEVQELMNIFDVSDKSGTNPKTKKPWTRYGVQVESAVDGTMTLGTFDKAIAEAARAVMGRKAVVSYIVDGKFKTITGIADAPESGVAQ